MPPFWQRFPSYTRAVWKLYYAGSRASPGFPRAFSKDLLGKKCSISEPKRRMRWRSLLNTILETALNFPQTEQV